MIRIFWRSFAQAFLMAFHAASAPPPPKPIVRQVSGSETQARLDNYEARLQALEFGQAWVFVDRGIRH